MPNWCSTDITFVSNCKKGNDDIRKLYDIISNQCVNGPNSIPNGFGYGWLGNFAVLYGISTKEEASNNNYNGYGCRGSITYVGELEDNYFAIQQEDAWSPNLSIWKYIIDHNFIDQDNNPTIDIYYQAEEPGDGIYVTNDDTGIYYTTMYNIDWNIELVPNIFPFYIQNTGSPFIKVDMNYLVNNGFNYYNSRSYNNSTLSMCIYKSRWLESKDELLEEMKTLYPNIDNIQQGYDEIDKYIEEYSDDSYISIHKYEYCSIEDIDPVNQKIGGICI